MSAGAGSGANAISRNMHQLVNLRRMCCAVFVASVMLIATGCSAQSGGACVAPQTTASPATAMSSQHVTVSGRYWQPCNDTNNSSEDPWPRVLVEWDGLGGSVVLGDLEISGGTFRGEVEIPSGADIDDGVLRISAAYHEVEIPVTESTP